MLEYSRDALEARPRFFAPYNDLTIVVEDTRAEGLYTQIIGRLFGNSLSIRSVLGMGGKPQVIQRFERMRYLPKSRLEFYLVDGDFDELIGRSCPVDNRFYRLKQYDIESFLLEEKALVSLAEEESPRKRKKLHKKDLQVCSWKIGVVDSSARLIACAALLQEIGERQTKLSLNADRYRMGDDIFPDKSKIDLEINRVSKRQSAISPEEFHARLDEMICRLGLSHSDRLRWISGKRMLIPLAIRLLRKQTGSNLKRESLCFRLAKFCEFPGLTELRNRISLLVSPAAREDDNLPSS